MINQYALLTTKRFLPLFIIKASRAFVLNTLTIALCILVAYRPETMTTIQPELIIAVITLLSILPLLLFSTIGSQLALKYIKSKVMVITNVTLVLLVALTVIGFYTHNIYILLLMIFALNINVALEMPIYFSLLPELLKEEELIAANGLVNACFYILSLIGMIFAGVCILKPNGELLVTGTAFLFSVLAWFASRYIPKTNAQNPQKIIDYNVVKKSVQLWHYFTMSKTNFYTFVGISWFVLMGNILMRQLPAFGHDVMHVDANTVSLLFALFAIGIAIGSLICNQLLKSKINITYVPLIMVLLAVFLLDFCLTASQLNTSMTSLMDVSTFITSFTGMRIFFDVLLLTICAGCYVVPLFALLQHESDQDIRSQVFASLGMIYSVFTIIGSIIVMLLLEFNVSIYHIFIIITISSAGTGIWLTKLVPGNYLVALIRQIKDRANQK